MKNSSSAQTFILKSSMENQSNNSLLAQKPLKRFFTMQQSKKDLNFDSFKSQPEFKPSSLISIDNSLKPSQRELSTKECSPICNIQKLKFQAPKTKNVFDISKYKSILKEVFEQCQKNKHQKKLRENIGLALLDSQGNFIWANKKSQLLFEIKLTPKSQNKNIFSLMINLSKFQLFKMFNGQNILNDGCFKKCFSYVIYSKEKKKKFIKKMKQKKIKKITFSESNKYFKDQIFFKYLNALSSEARKVRIKISDKYIKNPTLAGRKGLRFSDDFLNQIKEFKESSESIEETDIFVDCILLKTRQAKRVPNINFQQMKLDKTIQKFEAFVKKNLNIIQFLLIIIL